MMILERKNLKTKNNSEEGTLNKQKRERILNMTILERKNVTKCNHEYEHSEKGQNRKRTNLKKDSSGKEQSKKGQS